MGFISNFANKGAVFSSKDMGYPASSAVSEKDQLQNSSRVSRYELENIYLTDPQAFNTINKSKQLIMQAGFNIRAMKKGSQSKYDDFFNSIGSIGMKTNKNQLLSYIHHDKLLFGSAYVERIYDRELTEILDLKMIDPKLMDFARDTEGVIVVDKYQNPVGYTMDVGNRGASSMGDIPPTLENGISSEISLDSTEIFLLAFRIAHFRMFPFGNRFESIGIIEPAFYDIIRKHKIEDATANSIHNTAAYPIIGYVGDNQRSASQKVMNSTLDAMKNLSHSRYMVFQHPTKLETLEVKHSDQLDEVLRYFRGNQSAASGMALGFSIGTGEAINRSTLSTQQRMLDISLDSEAKATAQEFKVLILDELNRVNGYGSEAELIWGDVAAENKNEKMNRLMSAVKSSVIAPEEAREYILLSEGLKKDDSAYKKYSGKIKESSKVAIKNKNSEESSNKDKNKT